jgi:hypothetical protein
MVCCRPRRKSIIETPEDPFAALPVKPNEAAEKTFAFWLCWYLYPVKPIPN